MNLPCESIMASPYGRVRVLEGSLFLRSGRGLSAQGSMVVTGEAASVLDLDLDLANWKVAASAVLGRGDAG
jgi:hypothetical protein